MSDNILESYLVKLGATVDTSSFRKFDLTLQDSEKSVTGFATHLTSNFLKIEASIVGVFSSLGTSIIALADKTAMADQQYRLFGMRMLMSKESARAMQIATDQLGASLDEIAFDPELNKRFQFLYEQNIKLGRSMGDGFDQNMRSIRDMRMVYKMFTSDLEFLTGGVISKLFEKLGFGTGDVLNQMTKLQDWFANNLPGISNQIATDLIPVWNDFVVLNKDLASIFKTAAGDFSFLTGVITGDSSIKDTTFSFHNLVKATTDWLDVLVEVGLSLQLVGKEFLHVTTAAGAGFGAIKAMLHGDWKEATRLTNLQDKELGAAFDTALGIFDPGKNGQFIRSNSDFSGIVAHEDEKANRDNQSNTTNPDLAAIISAAGKQYNIDPNLLSAVISQESGYNSGAKSSKGAQGLMQLMPGTASEYGVSNPFDPSQNVQGGAAYLSSLLKRYSGNTALALGAYNSGPGNVDKYGGVPPFQETQHYVDRILRQYSRMSQQSSESGGGVIINSLTIQVPKHIPEERWKEIIRDSMTDITNKHTKNITAETAAGAYF